MPGQCYAPAVQHIAASKKLDGQSTTTIQTDLFNLGGSRSSIYRWSQSLHLTGSATRCPDLYQQMGRPRLLERDQAQSIVNLVHSNPIISDESIQNSPLAKFGIYLSERSINRYCYRLDLTHKKVDSKASEASEDQDTEYLFTLSEYSARQLICADKVHFNDKTSNALYAWSLSGERVVMDQPLNRGKSFSALALLTWEDGLLGVPCIGRGYNAEKTREMLETYVFPYSNSFPGPNSVLLWDGASIHKTEEVKADVAARGMRILHTPPYTPKRQPAENVFGAAKKLFRKEPWRKDDIEGPEAAIRKVIEDTVPDVATSRRFMLHTGIKEFSDFEDGL